MFLRNDSPLHLSSQGANHTRWRTQLTRLAPSKTLRLRSKCGRIKALTRLRNRSFFVGTLRSIATFRVSEEKFQISFWQRFFFLWLRFFLSFWSQQKERNEQNSFLRKDISLTLNMTLRHSEARISGNLASCPRQPRSSRKLTPRASQCSQTLCTFLRTYSFAIELRKSAINLRATASSFHGFSSSRLKSSFTG